MKTWWEIYYRRLAQLVGSPTPWAFLIAAVGIGLLGEGASKLVDAYLGQQPAAAGALTLLAGGAVLFLLVLLFNLPQMVATMSEWLRPSRQTSLQVTTHVPHRKGVIVLVSHGKFVPAADALAYHGWDKVPGRPPALTHCWLLAGPGEGELSSLANARRLQEIYAAKGVTVEIWPLSDADDVQEVYSATRTIYQVARNRYRLHTADLIVDYTGGTKTMTAGLVLAALAEGSDLQYMKPNAYTADGRADKGAGSQPRLVDFRFVDAPGVGEKSA